MSGQEQSADTVFQTSVNTLVEKAVQQANGLVLPDEVIKDVDGAVVYAARLELRARNTQATYTKNQQELARERAKNKQLADRLTASVSLGLTPQEQADLDKLKKSDPEKWRAQINEFEARAKANLTNEFNKIEESADQLSQVEVRTAQLEAFNNATGLTLTDDFIKENLPPIYFKKLEKGECTFLDFLKSAQDYLLKNKVIQGATDAPANNEPNLGKMTGGKEPSDQSMNNDIVAKYNTTIY